MVPLIPMESLRKSMRMRSSRKLDASRVICLRILPSYLYSKALFTWILREQAKPPGYLTSMLHNVTADDELFCTHASLREDDWKRQWFRKLTDIFGNGFII